MKISIIPILYTRRAKTSGKYPVKLKLLFNREKKYYSTGVDLTESEFKNLHIDRSLKRHLKVYCILLIKPKKSSAILAISLVLKNSKSFFSISQSRKPVIISTRLLLIIKTSYLKKAG